MSKVTNVEEIKAMAIERIQDSQPEALEYLTEDELANVLTIIYLTNDLTTGFGQDYRDNISIISSPTRIAIIGQGTHSFYKVDGDLCEYEDLEEDIDAILLCLETAIARWEAMLEFLA